MKLLLVLFAVLGLSYAVPQTRDLSQDLQELLDLIPLEEIREIAARFNAEDPEFQQVVAYLQGPEWAELVATVRDNPTWQAFKDFMLERGVDVDAIIETIRDIIQNARYRKPKPGRSIRDFVDEVLALIDLDAILVKLNELLERPSFQEFWEAISSEESRAFVNEVRALEEVQRVANVLRDFGIDIDLLIDLVTELLGWN